jgi:hypothetical protein
MDHYRSYHVRTITGHLRISDSLDWFPEKLHVPGSQPIELLIASMADIAIIMEDPKTQFEPEYSIPLNNFRKSISQTVMDLREIHAERHPNIQPPGLPTPPTSTMDNR